MKQAKFAQRQAARTRWHAREARKPEDREQVAQPLPGSADDALSEANRLIAEVRAEREAAKHGR